MLRRAVLPSLLVALGTVPAAAQPIAVTNVSIVDASAATPVTVGAIVVHNGRITAVGGNVTVPPDAHVIDARGKFVVPGLWDMHAHLAALTPIGRAPERYVGHGVLNLRDMGGHLEQLLPLRAEIRAGRRTGPEMVLAGPTLNSEQPAPFHRKITTAADARTAVQELKAAGVDVIKIHRATSREVFDALADETRRAGLPLSGHVPLVMSWTDAARAGMRTIEHIQTIFENLQPDLQMTPALFDGYATRLDGRLGDEIFATLKSQGTYFDPTLIGYELELLVSIGLTPQQVLTAATSTSADAAGRPELGRLRAGGPASFLIVDANPLENISQLRRLSAVMLRGRLHEASALAQLRQ